MQPDGPKPGLVIFDCDGVLVDSELISLEVLRELVRSKGVEISLETIVDRFLGRSLAHERAVLSAEYGVTLTDADIAAMSDKLYALFKRELQPVKGVVGPPGCHVQILPQHFLFVKTAVIAAL